MHGSKWVGFVTAAVVVAVSMLSAELHAAGGITAEAVAGRPFGVASITLPPSTEIATLADTNSFVLVERDGRALYPTFTAGRIRRILAEFLNADLNGPASLSVSFLFTGDQPLRVTLYAPQPIEIEIIPRPQPPRAFNRLLDQWWKDYNAAARLQQAEGDYSPIVQTYLTSMLSRRLNLDPPLLNKLTEKPSNDMQQNLQLLLGQESLQLATMKATVFGTSDLGEFADQPLPPEIAWGPKLEPAFDPAAAIEPMALHVPEECFYIRFGRFSNYVWMSHLLDDYGGDIGSMVTLRGINTGGDERMERQLSLKQTVIGDLFGDAVIADVAIIGRDLYLDEGPAMGMLFQARNALLGSNLRSERQATLNEERKNGCTLETVMIAGREVSFLATPDNRVRSFYAVDGDFHLISTSRQIVERFFEVGAGGGALGQSSAFKHARSVLPVNREDTVFVYFSSAFFRGLASPQYQIELGRRLQSLTDLHVLALATLAARAERQPAESVDDLIAAELLPLGFGKRPDGSGPIVEEHRMLDSRRGARGSFLPIPDVELTAITPSEAKRCAARAAFFASQWKQMDPLLVGIKRFALDKDGRERIVIDAHVSPLEEGKYGKLLSVLGPASPDRITPADGDMIHVQALVKGGLLSPSVPSHHLFLGVQDALPLSDLKPSGIIKTLRMLQTTPGYLGAWPKPGFLDWLPLGLGGGRPDPGGYSALLFGIWRRQWDTFSALAFDRRVLEFVTPQLRIEPTDTDAQIRIHVGDLSTAKLATWVNHLCYDRAHAASVGNVRFLHAISQQLAVPREEARDVAERLLDAQLVCALGGQYEFASPRGRTAQWVSTKWTARGDEAPPDYNAPLLEWFRGLDANLTKEDHRLVVHAQLDIQRKASEAKIELPLFNNLFGGPKPAVNGADKKDRAAVEKKSELPKPKPPATGAKKPREF